MSGGDIASWIAAVMSTFAAVLQFYEWKKQRRERRELEEQNSDQ